MENTRQPFFKRIIRTSLIYLSRIFKYPYIYRLVRNYAKYFNIRLNYSGKEYGQNHLIIEDSDNPKAKQIPSSVYFNSRSGKIIVGRNTLFGEDVKVLTGKHMTIFDLENDHAELHFVPPNGRDITIGSNCYIGSSAILIGRLNIGDNSVIGAGSVVVKDVPPNSFVAGNPAKVIKTLK